jgi:hypothetical protein
METESKKIEKEVTVDQIEQPKEIIENVSQIMQSTEVIEIERECQIEQPSEVIEKVSYFIQLNDRRIQSSRNKCLQRRCRRLANALLSQSWPKLRKK